MSGKIPEAIPPFQLPRYIAGVHAEGQLVTGMVATAQPGERFTPARLALEVTARQGDEPAWEIGPETVTTYCRDSLVPIGAIDVARMRREKGRPADVYQAAPRTGRLALAYFGVLSIATMDTSLTLRTCFGQAQRIQDWSSAEVETSSPYVRYRLYGELLGRPEEGSPSEPKTVNQLYHALGAPGLVATLQQTVDGLTDAGVLVKSEGAGQLFRFPATAEEYGQWARSPRRSTSAAGLALRQAAVNLYGRKDVFTYKELEEEIRRCDPKVDLKQLPRLITREASEGRLLTTVSDGRLNDSQVSINPAHASTLRDLRRRLESLAEPEYIDIYCDLATDLVLRVPEALHRLMQKADEASMIGGHLRARGRENTQDMLERLLREHGTQSVTGAVALLAGEGRHLSISAVDKSLRTMERTGRITAESHPREGRRGRRDIMLYSSVPESKKDRDT